MSSKAFLLLALALSVVLLISSEVAADNVEYEVHGRGGYNRGGGHGGYHTGGGRGGYHNGRGHGGGGCRHGCCGGGRHGGGCKCCNTFAEATAYKQTQN